ncbi:LEO1 [Sanghuangporus sanghuang]
MDDFLDPQLLLHGDAARSEDDLFGEDIKPKVEQDQIKAGVPEHDEEMEDLFGDEEAPVEPPKEKSLTPAASTGREESEALSAAEILHRQEMEYEEDEGQDENVVELKHAVLSIPNIPMPKSSDGNYWVIRMPNFVKLDSKPFHPDTYTGPEQSPSGISERERSMSIKLDVENTIRWRWAKDEFGQDTRQSNSRVIRWSDGTLSLMLGKELFDINQTYDGGISHQSSLSQSQGLSQNTSQQPSGGRGSGLTYLVAQHKRSGILQTEVPVTGHMTLRPTGMQSETHRRLARAVGQKHSRIARLKLADASVEQEAQEAQKAAQKKPKAARVARENGKLGRPSQRRRTGFARRRESVWSDEEPEGGAFEETDEEDEGEYDSSPRRRRGSGGGRRDADAKRGAGEYQTDDFLVADSSEGEDDFETSPKRAHKSKKQRRRSEDNDAEGEPDELEKLDRKIQQQQEERHRKKQGAEVKEGQGSAEPAETRKSEEVAMDMDIESEEEEEEFNVRRTGTGSRKKRAIALDDDEEE